MSKLYAFLVMLVLVTGCQKSEITNPPNSSPSSKAEDVVIHPINLKVEDTIEMIGWFDHQSLLYLLSDDHSFELYIHNILTGEERLFFAEESEFYRIDPSENSQLFALQTINTKGNVELSILNSDGDQILKPELKADEYKIYWSPYKESDLMAVAFLPDWKHEVFQLSVDSSVIDKTEIQSSYLQWSSPDSVAFLDWDASPSFEAPLTQYNLKNHQTSQWYGSGLFFSDVFQNRTLVVKYNDQDENVLTYEFTDGQDKLGEITIPVLNTFSEQWWITSYAYAGHDDIFYYLRPHYAADFVAYKDGFDLMAYDIHTDSDRKLWSSDTQESIALSSDGSWILTGEQKQTLIRISDGKVYELF